MSGDFEVLVTDVFEEWYEGLDDTDADKVYFVVELLEAQGVHLGHPYSSQIQGSRYNLIQDA